MLDQTGRPLAVVTRPRSEAEATAVRIREHGYGVLVEPLLDYVGLSNPLPPLDGFRALIFTSANGVRAFAEASPERALPAYVVGPGTEAAACAHGFVEIRRGDGDGVALARRIGDELACGDAVLHAAGAVVAGDLDAVLTARGIKVHRAELYEMRSANRLSEALIAALYARTVDVVLFYSPRTASVFADLAEAQGVAGGCSGAMALCLSKAVAAKAEAVAWRRIAVAAQPTAEALLELLPAIRT